MKKQTCVLICWMLTWLMIIGCWVYSLSVIVNVDRIATAIYVSISGCAFITLLCSTNVDGEKYCTIGLHDWVEWKDQDRYPQMKRVCLDCGRIQELYYDFFTFSWSDI